VRKILFLFGLIIALRVSAAEPLTVTMTDGVSFTGDLLKFDDNGILLRATGDVYTNLVWGRFSQESLKQLAANVKIKPLVEPFIEPDATTRPPKAEIKVNSVQRMEQPANPSVLGGLFHSGVGLMVLLLVYLANLYAAYEVSIIRARPALQVIGLAAALPIIGPIIFLAMPVRMEAPPEEKAELIPGPTLAGKKAHDDIQIVEASWKQEDKKKVEPQIFARGKFTFNRRFLETKFAAYVGEPKPEAKKNVMHLKSGQGLFTVERIAQVGATDLIIETVERGQVTVVFADIQEIKLEPRPEPKTE
jgi:hypothetical protein